MRFKQESENHASLTTKKTNLLTLVYIHGSLLLASVIIYTYDRREYILKAVESVLSQSVPRNSYEIIVVKGFTDDRIDDFLREKCDRVLLVPDKSHGKKLAAGIRASAGDVIFILDDDDEFAPEKLKTCLEFFSKNDRLNFLHNATVWIDETGKNLPGPAETVPQKNLAVDTSNMRRSGISEFLRYRANWYSSSMGFRRRIFDGRFEYIERVNQSIDPFLFFVAISCPGEALLIPDRLSRYRVHPSTTNYLATYEDFIESRKIFYRNSSRVFGIAVEMSKGSASASFIAAAKTQMDFIASVLDSEVRIGEQCTGILDYVRSFNSIFTRYQILWLVMGTLRLVSFHVTSAIFFRYFARFYEQVLPT